MKITFCFKVSGNHKMLKSKKQLSLATTVKVKPELNISHCCIHHDICGEIYKESSLHEANRSTIT
jgi:hypothetical protein